MLKLAIHIRDINNYMKFVLGKPFYFVLIIISNLVKLRSLKVTLEAHYW